MLIPWKSVVAILGLGISMLVVPDAVKAGVLREQWNFETSATTQTGTNGNTLVSSQANAVSTDVPFTGNSNKLTADGNHRLLGATNQLSFSTTGFSFNFWLKDYDHSSTTDSYLYLAPNYYQSGTSSLFSWDFGGQMIFGCIHNWSCTTVYNTLTASDYYALGTKNYWHMFTINIGSSYYEIFLDGVSKVKKTFPTHVWDGAIMSYNDVGAQSNYLLIDELSEYGGLLSQSQIDYLYTHTQTSPGALSVVFPTEGQIVKDFPNWVLNYSTDRYYPKLRLLIDAWANWGAQVEWNDYEIVPGMATTTQWSLKKVPPLSNGEFQYVAKLQSLTNCDQTGLFCDATDIATTATTTFEIDNTNGDTYLTTTLDDELDAFYQKYDCKTICNDVATSTGLFDEFRYGFECGGKTVLCWAFIPSRDSVHKGKDAIDGFKENFPLSLAYDVYDTISTTTATSSQVLDLGDIFPGSTTMIVMSSNIADNWTQTDWFQNSIYIPMKWILYALTLLYCVRRTFRTGAPEPEYA